MSSSKSPALRKKRHDDLPATLGFVKNVRAEVLAELRSVHHKIDKMDRKHDGRGKRLEGRIDAMDKRLGGRIDGLEGRVGGLECEMREFRSEMSEFREEMRASFHRMEALNEEQRSENRIVMDELKSIWDRQDRVETDVADLRKTVDLLGRAKPSN